MSFFSHPLFSAAVALYTLVFLYCPHRIILRLVLSPVFIFTSILLLLLTRLGAQHKVRPDQTHHHPADHPHLQNKLVELETPPLLLSLDDPTHQASFVEWDFGARAPLEVIHEGKENDDDDNDHDHDHDHDHDDERKPSDAVSEPRPINNVNVVERYPSLSRYYPETDSDSGSDSGDSLERYFERGGPEREEGLIEIEIETETASDSQLGDNNNNNNNNNNSNNKGKGIPHSYHMDFYDFDDEDNLIEIDIS